MSIRTRLSRVVLLFAFLLISLSARAQSRLSIAFAANSYVSAESLFGHLFFVEKDPAVPYPLWQVYEFSADGASLVDGVFGGISGSFRTRKLYQKLSEYSDLEQRNVWIYELKLSGEEMARVRREIVQGEEQPYFFFTQNCATEVYKKLVSKEKRRWGVWSPLQVLHELDRQEVLGEPWWFEPASVRASQMYESLNAQERKQVRYVIDLEYSKLSRDLSVTRSVREFLKRYYSQKPTEVSWHKGWFKKANWIRTHFGETEDPGADRKIESPLDQQRMFQVEGGAGIDSGGRSSGILGFRPAFKSLNDSRVGRSGFHELELLGLRLKYQEDRVSLRDFQLVSFASLRESNWMNPALSWSARLNYKDESGVFDERYLNLSLAVGQTLRAGMVWSFLPTFSTRYALNTKDFRAGAGVEFKALSRWGVLTLHNSVSYLFWSKTDLARFFGALNLDYYLSTRLSVFSNLEWVLHESQFRWNSLSGLKYYF